MYLSAKSSLIRHSLSWILFYSICISAFAQAPKKWHSGEIYNELERLKFLGSVLYVAAHPDDENTRLISYLANEKKAYTTYLSLTRGDGGQNLIGTEINELLGVLRTQELLMARSVDNGHQMFTRANDFGFSKNAEETIRIWDTEKVKADVVWAIRKLRPDVIINRFDHRTSGETHGHHTASAILALELFDKSGDKNSYPEHLQYVQPWSARRIFFNTSWWFYGSQEKFDKADKSKLMSMDVGVYFPLLGKSNTEIAAESRSKHKCQGFGSTGTRGSQLEYLELLKGDMPEGKDDIFKGINTSWSRVKGGEQIDALIDKALEKFDFRNPALILPELTKIYKAIEKTDDPFWTPVKMEECKKLMAACTGLFLEAKTNQHKITVNETITVDIEAIQRLGNGVVLKALSIPAVHLDSVMDHKLEENEIKQMTFKIKIPENTALTAPYWLLKKGSQGLFQVERQDYIGLPETPRSLFVDFYLNIGGVDLSYRKDIVYKFNSPENGETYRPLEIVPAITLSVKEPVYIFGSNDGKDVLIDVYSWAEAQKGKVSLPLPKGWKCVPESYDFEFKTKGESRTFSFNVIPPYYQEQIEFTPKAVVNGVEYENEMVDIKYDHIPHQTVIRKSTAQLSRIDIQIKGRRIAYVMGAGDQIPQSLQQIGYNVEMLKPEEISVDRLSAYDALVMGVRAYNTEEGLKFKQKEIMDYVSKGGNVIVQYNTSNGLVTKDLGPYPLTLSRFRTSVEDAEMRFLHPQHEILNKPNKITAKDFEGWVQERGLYFPGEWDSNYTAVLSCNDPGEPPRDGTLLVTKYGEGYYIYSGLSFFRQLPAGVSGAFRLFANMLSLGKTFTP